MLNIYCQNQKSNNDDWYSINIFDQESNYNQVFAHLKLYDVKMCGRM